MGLEIAAELIYLSSHQGQGRLCTQQRLHHQYHHDYYYYYARTQHDDEREIQLNLLQICLRYDWGAHISRAVVTEDGGEAGLMFTL